MNKYFNKKYTDRDDDLYNFDSRDIIFHTYDEARHMLDRIKTRAGAFGTISISEFKQLCGFPTRELYSKHGWNKAELECAYIDYTLWKGYSIIFPKPHDIVLDYRDIGYSACCETKVMF